MEKASQTWHQKMAKILMSEPSSEEGLGTAQNLFSHESYHVIQPELGRSRKEARTPSVLGLKNKMEPTNPNANTFKKLHYICPNDTLVGHSCGTLLWVTLMGHSCGTLFWVTLLGNSCGTLLRDTLVGHSSGTFLWDTLVGHYCRTLLWDTLVGHSCETLL